jgi:hypothetical protein
MPPSQLIADRPVAGHLVAGHLVAGQLITGRGVICRTVLGGGAAQDLVVALDDDGVVLYLVAGPVAHRLIALGSHLRHLSCRREVVTASGVGLRAGSAG